MRDSIRVFLRYVGISLKAQMQYRASFIMLTLTQLLLTGTDIMAIWVLFSRFGSLRGWRLPEVALLYGIVNVSFGLAELLGRGFDMFAAQVKSGDFDRLLLRPRSTAFQVAAGHVQAMRIGRILQAGVVLVWAMITLHVHWSPSWMLLLVFAIAGCCCLFYGLLVLYATVAFWTTESLEVMNIVIYGGTEVGSFPPTIFRPWFRRIFIFVVPLACVTYLPALPILGRPDEAVGTAPWFHWVAPLAGFAFLVVSLQVWKLGVRHYRSTGS